MFDARKVPGQSLKTGTQRTLKIGDGGGWVPPGGNSADYTESDAWYGGLEAPPGVSVKAYRVIIFNYDGHLTLDNIAATDIKRDDGTHDDGFFIAADKGWNGWITLANLMSARIAGENILIESGSYDTIEYVECEVDWKFEINLNPGCHINRLTFDGCRGNISIVEKGGSLGEIWVNNHVGNVPHRAGTRIVQERWLPNTRRLTSIANPLIMPLPARVQPAVVSLGFNANNVSLGRLLDDLSSIEASVGAVAKSVNAQHLQTAAATASFVNPIKALLPGRLHPAYIQFPFNANNQPVTALLSALSAVATGLEAAKRVAEANAR